MKNQNISKKILHWYDNNRRELPWRKYISKKQTQYFTLVSEFMLQQTQVKTVIPYFNNFINKISNLKKLANVSEAKLMKCWEGLGYYSRARNLKQTAKKIISEFNSNLPSTIEELKTLPGIGDYTSRAIMAIVFNKPIIPLDGNVERVLKRIFYLRNVNEISKDNIINKKSFFGKSNRSSDYAQAIMEIGALICKPVNPLCFKCPISKNCKSYKKNDFEIKSKNKFNKIKYFEADIYQNQNKYLLIKNNKFKFLKNLLIFPMKEVKKNKFNTSTNKKVNIKMSNMDMRIVLNKKKKLIKIRNSCLLDKKNVKGKILPSFTKKIINTASNFS
ncbi:MAG: A/G-specific adenine glycosylase [Pelagibacterales bacterium]|nr:A/G-specific adenine glycosylase [Pelagibacterales bacterium]